MSSLHLTEWNQIKLAQRMSSNCPKSEDYLITGSASKTENHWSTAMALVCHICVQTLSGCSCHCSRLWAVWRVNEWEASQEQLTCLLQLLLCLVSLGVIWDIRCGETWKVFNSSKHLIFLVIDQRVVFEGEKLICLNLHPQYSRTFLLFEALLLDRIFFEKIYWSIFFAETSNFASALYLPKA